jgi:hypothetical protein
VFLSACSTLAPTLSAEYARGAAVETYAFRWGDPNDGYLTRLRTQYDLESLVSGKESDIERAEAVCAWVHGLWEHHSSNTPARNDPIYILQKVAEGERYRCVEYGIVISGCLNAVGIPSRIMSLKTKDVETSESGSGHVVAEAYLPDIGKWVFLDGQWGVVPFSGDVPLSGLQLMESLADADPNLHLWTAEPTDAARYYDWISDYLYFYSVPFDNRVGDDIKDWDPLSLMLVPLGERNPVVFERHRYAGKSFRYTNSIQAFYATPVIP